MAYFLGLRSALASELERKFGPNRPHLKTLAEKVGMPASTLQMYLEGRRRPKRENIDRLARYFYPVDKVQREGFVQKLMASRDKMPPGRGLLEELAAGVRPFRVRSLNYPPLSGRHSFVGDFFLERFLPLSGIKVDSHDDPFPDSRDVEAVQDGLQSGNMDLVLGHLSTADRALRLQFVVQTPVRVSLGAICHKKHVRHLSRLRSVLLRGKAAKSGAEIRPILLPREVGWLHCTKRLGYEERDITVVHHLDEGEFVAALQKLETQGGSAIPVIVVDELTSIRILGKMNGSGVPIIPLSTERSLRDCECRREMPVYSLGAPISRIHSDLAAFFAEALPVFMQNDVERIARDYFDLYGKLVDVLVQNTGLVALEYLDHTTEEEQQYFDDTARDRSIPPEDAELIEKALRSSLQRRWVRTMLRLKLDDIVSYQSPLPWQPILVRTREKLDQQIGREEIATIREFVEVAGKRHEWYRLHRIFADIEESYDVRLERQLYYPSGLGAPAPALSYKVASALLHRPARVNPKIQRPDRRQVKEAEMILQEAASLYHTQDERKSALKKVSRLVREFEKHCRNYLLATVEGEPAGLIHVEPVPGRRTRECEIAQLFVRPVWRSYGLARKLVLKAISRAHADGFQMVRVNVLEATHEAVMLYRMMGFQEASQIDSSYLTFPCRNLHPADQSKQKNDEENQS
jgi:GNAT superfamily N-acetyltransferase/transcriptional regulator with XRE-family HTH domain